MRKHFLILILFSLIFASCIAPAEPTSTVIISTRAVSSGASITPTANAAASPIPSIGTPTSLTTVESAATELTPNASFPSIPPGTAPSGQPVNLTSIHMYSGTGGWAQANVPDSGVILLHTVDGGQRWKEVTPEIAPNGSFGASFLDENTAWVYTTDSSGSRASLVRTLDGGSTWETINRSLPASFLSLSAGMTFLNREEGWAEVVDVGAGQAYIQVYTTQDGGSSWNQVMLGNPEEITGEPAGTLHLCNICSDSFYYDPIRQIITYGDLASDPVGKVRASISFDQGKTWKDFELPFPSAKFAGALVAPQAPVFFNQSDGVLPVGLVKLNADGTHAYDILAIYTTHTGGVSWTPDPVFVERVSNLILSHSVIDFVSSQDAFVPCGADLCATNDGMQTWHALHANLNFTYSEANREYVEQFDFLSPRVGWAILTNGDTSSLWKTDDGGHTWEEINLLLITK